MKEIEMQGANQQGREATDAYRCIRRTNDKSHGGWQMGIASALVQSTARDMMLRDALEDVTVGVQDGGHVTAARGVHRRRDVQVLQQKMAFRQRRR